MQPVFAEAGAEAGAKAEDVEKSIPVTSELVRSACGACHAVDDSNRLSRISYERKAPGGWGATLKRMLRTGQVQLSPEQAKEIVRYLSDRQGCDRPNHLFP